MDLNVYTRWTTSVSTVDVMRSVSSVADSWTRLCSGVSHCSVQTEARDSIYRALGEPEIRENCIQTAEFMHDIMHLFMTRGYTHNL